MTRADFESECLRCGHEIRKGELIAPWRGGYMHTSCAPGADD